MKKFRRALFALVGIGWISANAEVIHVSAFPTRIRESNLRVSSERFRVRQARESVELARLNLLPRLQIWHGIEATATAFGMTIGTEAPTLVQALTGLLEDVAPFLVPANWYRVDQAREAAAAQYEGFLTWSAQELFSARTLALQIRHDERILAEYVLWGEAAQQLADEARVALIWGGITPERLRRFEEMLLRLNDDQSELTRILEQEKRTLGWTLGMDRWTDSLTLLDSELPSFVDADLPLDSVQEDWILHRAQMASPEIRQVRAFQRAQFWAQKQIAFSVFGNASIPGTTALPFQQGLGFGWGASQRIQELAHEDLELQEKGVAAELIEQVRRAQSVLNIERQQRAMRIRSLRRAEEYQLQSRAYGGRLIEARMDAWDLRVQASVRYLAAELKLSIAQERLRRLLWTSEYRELQL